MIPDKRFSIFLLLGFINALFIYKYGLRFTSLAEVSGIYLLFIFIQIFLFKVFHVVLKRYHNGNYVFWALAAAFFIVTIVINIRVDGNTLHVDRWSAMHVGIKALLHGEYPYTAVDHLGGRTSNLPGLLFIGIPFYLLGNVGFLQSFTFIALAIFIYRQCQSAQDRVTTLFLFVSSPCYLYEIYVKSDLISNFILVLITVMYAHNVTEQKTFKRPFSLGLLTSFIFYTRLTAIIPLALVFFSRFIRWKWKIKFSFLTGALIGLLVLTIVVFIPFPSYNILMEKNPFLLQNRQLPFLLSVFFIILPCLLSYKIKDRYQLLKYCVITLALPVFTAMILYMFEFGFWPAIRDSRFDLSYLNILTPFLILYLGYDSSFAQTQSKFSIKRP